MWSWVLHAIRYKKIIVPKIPPGNNMILCDIFNAFKVWLFFIVHTNISINWMKTCPCKTVGTKIDNVLGLLAQGNVIVEFGRKVFLVDCLLWNNIKYCENKHNRKRSSFFQVINSKWNHSRKHNCDVVSKWRHSVSSSSYPCQSRYDVGSGLRIMSRG